jgi:hypothetical protein
MNTSELECACKQVKEVKRSPPASLLVPLAAVSLHVHGAMVHSFILVSERMDQRACRAKVEAGLLQVHDSQ